MKKIKKDYKKSSRKISKSKDIKKKKAINGLLRKWKVKAS